MKLKNMLEKTTGKVDAAEIYSAIGKNLSVSFENNKIKDSSSSELSGVGVRVIRDGKLGFSSSSLPNDEKVADTAVDLARFGRKVSFTVPANAEKPVLTPDTSGTDKINEAFCVENAETAVEELKKLGEGVMAFSGISKTDSSSRLLNSNGLDIEQSRSIVSWYSGVILNTEGNFIQIYDMDYGSEYTGFDRQIEKVKENFRLCSVNEKVQTGKYKVLLSPRGFNNFLSVFSACLSGQAASKGISPWVDKKGEQLFDSKLTLLTDLVSEDVPLRQAYDDEGVYTGKKVLIENGVLKSFYHSLNTAADCGDEPTGHGFRSPSTLPAPSLYGAKFLPGSDSLKDLMAQADVWIDSLIGAVMCNPYGGIINGNVSLGFTMENGNRKARIKDAMLSINVFDLFKNAVIGLSKEVEQVGKWSLPYVLIDGASLASK